MQRNIQIFIRQFLPLLLTIAAVSLFFNYLTSITKPIEWSFTELRAAINTQGISSINIYDDGQIEGRSSAGAFVAKIPSDSVAQWTEYIEEKSPATVIKSIPPRQPSFFAMMLPWIIPILIFWFIF